MTEVPQFLPDDDTPTPYEVLGIRYDATDGDIKAARRQVLAENHPDRRPGDAHARALFDAAATAAELLLDPMMRQMLNAEIAERLQRKQLETLERLGRSLQDYDDELDARDTRPQAVKDWVAEVGERQVGDVIVPNPLADGLEESERQSRREMTRYFNMSEKQNRRYDRKQARKVRRDDRDRR